MTEKATEYEIETYQWRKNSESKDPNYCGSCSLEVHVIQMRDPDSWVHSAVKRWRQDWDRKLHVKKIKELNIPSTLNECQLRILALTDSLEEQTAIVKLLEGQIKQTAQGERSADQEVERLQKKVERLEIELIRTDDRWLKRLREQDENWYLRTRAIQKQLDVASTIMAEDMAIRPPWNSAPIVVTVKDGGHVATPHPEEPVFGCTWPVGNCQCLDGDQEDGS